MQFLRLGKWYQVFFLILLFFPLGSGATQVKDPCEDMFSNWGGTWRETQKNIQRTCTYQVDGHFKRIDNGFLFFVKLFNLPSQRLCGDAQMKTGGTCSNGYITLNAMNADGIVSQLKGKIIENKIHFEDSIFNIELIKKD